MIFKKVDFSKRHIAYFITIPGIISISLSLIFCRYLSFRILHQRAIEFNMPHSIKDQCDKEVYWRHTHWFGASDMYGHLNLVITTGHHILYHTVYRPIDWNPCHHLNPDKTQIIIDADAFKECDINEIGAVILYEQKKHQKKHSSQEQKRKIVSQMPPIDGGGSPITLYEVDDKNMGSDKEKDDGEFKVTFSCLDGAKYDDFIKILDVMLEYDVKIYSLRDLTTSEVKAIKKLGY